jgi:hypothetical protein
MAARMMFDHLACAENYRQRAEKCRSTAETVGSARFADCYRLLSDYYLFLAKYEEDYVHRAVGLERRRSGHPET